MEEQDQPLKEEWEKLKRSLRIPVMVLFTMGCFGLLLFLWVSFGGSLPLKANKYEVTVNFPDATTLAQAADVRIAGVNVGKVKSLSLNKGAAREEVVLDIDSQYAPLPKDTRAILRQKTLLGETFVELTPGNRKAGTLKDGATLPNPQVEPTVSLDQILTIFDPKTKAAFRNWVAESAAQLSPTQQFDPSQDLNDALGNLAGFAQDGAGVLSVLNDQQVAVRDLVKNTGVVFGALAERQGALRGLIEHSNATFETTAREQAALQQIFAVFPTFLDQSRLTLARLETFSVNTHPLVNDLKPVADDLGPTVRDLGDLAPDLQTLFIKLKPVIRVSGRDLPQGARLLTGARQVVDGLHVMLPELNPILSYLNFSQTMVAHFLSNGPPALTYRINGDPSSHMLPQFGVIDGRSLNLNSSQGNWVRGNAYIQPNSINRSIALGTMESFSCGNTGAGGLGTVRQPDPNIPAPPCFVAGPSLYSGHLFSFLGRGQVNTHTKPPVNTLEGHYPANAQTHP